MKRRDVIAGIAGAVAAWPASARAQQGKVAVVGFLASNALAEIQPLIAGLRKGLSEAGHAEGRNLEIVFRSCDGDYSRLPTLAAEFLAQKVDVILAQGPPAAHAAKTATTTIPVVFAAGTDPVATGLVASLARPGGNLTGNAMFMTETVAKRLDLLIELLPKARRFALLVNPNFPNPWVGSVENVARVRGVQLQIMTASTDSDIEIAFAAMARERIEAFVTGQDPFLGLRPKVPEMSVNAGIPMMGFIRSNTLQGALVSYGIDLPDAFRELGHMVSKILKGANPADLAVQRPVKFEMSLNLKTAKMLGITVPPALLAQADEVIE